MFAKIVPPVLQCGLPKRSVPSRLPLVQWLLEINGVNERATSISREADLVARKDECLGVCLWKSREPQREHAASPPRQRYFPSGAGVRLRFDDYQFASRNHSVLPFEVQVPAPKCLCLTRAQTSIKTEDKERKQRRTPA